MCFSSSSGFEYFNPELFFFSSRRRHTRLQGDWSSDVCSSDLQRLSIIRNWLDAVEQALSMRPMIYTRQNFIEPLLGEEVKTLATSGLWIAHYKVAQPSTPSSWA